MSSSIVDTTRSIVVKVRITEVELACELADGRTISAPIAWYPRLVHATEDERNQWRLIAGGRGIHWPALDEDVSIENLLAGKPSGESQASFKKWLSTRGRLSSG